MRARSAVRGAAASSGASRWVRGLFSRRRLGVSWAAWFIQAVAAAACAPSQSFRPAGLPDAAGARELGLAFSRVGPRPYVNETPQYLGQAWWSTKLDERWSVTALGAFEQTSAAGGAALRFDIA